jgi:hypothetical protein
MRDRLQHLVLGGLTTLLLCLGVAWLATHPTWRSLPAETAVLRVSFTHSGDRSGSCRDRTAEELAKLPPNMRNAQVCDRRRPPILVQIEIDGKIIYTAEKAPSGLAGSGPSRVYERLRLPAGAHVLTVRMRDNPRTEGFDYEATRDVVLKPEQSFVIDFRKDSGFVFE